MILHSYVDKINQLRLLSLLFLGPLPQRRFAPKGIVIRTPHFPKLLTALPLSAQASAKQSSPCSEQHILPPPTGLQGSFIEEFVGSGISRDRFIDPSVRVLETVTNKITCKSLAYTLSKTAHSANHISFRLPYVT